MEHRLITGGEQYLPFARSCIAKLKKLGMAYADQSFEVDGVSIKVRIEPGHEYIRIEGGVAAEYEVTPKSAENMIGAAPAILSISSTTRKFKAHTSRGSGPIDWLSFDGVDDTGAVRYGQHMITWNSGIPCRYNPKYSYRSPGAADTFIHVDGTKVEIGGVPNGVGMRKFVRVDGSNDWCVIVAALGAADRLDMYYFHLSDAGTGAAELIPVGQFTATQATTESGYPTTFTGHTFFDGRAENFGTLTSTGASPMILNATRFYQVSGAISMSEIGVPEVQFVETPLPSSTGIGNISGSDVTFVEYLGVDAKITGEIVAIKQQYLVHINVGSLSESSQDLAFGVAAVSEGGWIEEEVINGVTYYVHYNNVAYSSRTTQTWVGRYGSFGEGTETLTVGSEDIYSLRRVNSHINRVDTITGTYANHPRTGPWTGLWHDYATVETGYGDDITGIILHDLDARFGTYAATKTVLHPSIGTNSWGYSYSEDTSTRWGDYGPTHTAVATSSVSNYMVIRTIAGETIETLCQDKVHPDQAYLFAFHPMNGTARQPPPESNTDFVASSAAFYSRRVASRKKGSFLGSTTLSRQAGLYTPEVITAASLNVSQKNGNPVVFTPPWKSVGLSETDTQISLFDLRPIFK